ncbi:hypothetical protein [Sciscionella sediminilitoris]|uniref:hypothetical protein n=1 Tax=Sciscionella sediminilitoris TaxID=1445613 RepID=UPI0012E2D7A4|nr:hypothetical protein [Sciscionella sp. SE31]
MVEVTMYQVRVERGEKFWLVYVAGVDRWTQAKRFSEVEDTARDLVAVMDDVDPESIELTVEVSLPDLANQRLEHARQLREAATRANAEAAEETRAAVHTLIEDSGLSQQEVADVLTLSKQRVSQLVNG